MKKIQPTQDPVENSATHMAPKRLLAGIEKNDRLGKDKCAHHAPGESQTQQCPMIQQAPIANDIHMAQQQVDQ
jgi:hypothetical protein